MPPFRRYQMRFVAAVALVGLVVVVALLGGALALTLAQHRTSFQERAGQIERLVATRLKEPLDALSDARALFLASSFVDRSQFSLLFEHLQTDHPLLTSALLAQRVNATERAAFERARREEGFVTFAIHGHRNRPRHAASASATAPAFPTGTGTGTGTGTPGLDHIAIIYVTPFTVESAGLVGLDLGAAPLWRQAIEKSALEETSVGIHTPGLQGEAAEIWLLRALRRGEGSLSLGDSAPPDLQAVIGMLLHPPALFTDFLPLHPSETLTIDLRQGAAAPNRIWPLGEEKDSDPLAAALLPPLQASLSLPLAGLTMEIQFRRTLAVGDLVGVNLLLGLAASLLPLAFLVAASRSHLALRALNAELENRVTRRTETLRRSEANLASAQRIAHLGSWRLETATNELLWSAEIYNIFGFDPEAGPLTYEAFLEAVHPADRTLVDQRYQASLAGTQPYDVEHRILRQDDGQVRWVRERCQHSHDATGKVIRSEGTVQDITEQKQAEILRKANTLRMQMLLDLGRQATELDNEALLERSLDIAVAVTGSQLGYLHFVNDDQETLSLSTWNQVARRQCQAVHDDHYPLSAAGIWADCVRQRQPVIHNDFPALQPRPSYDQGHPTIQRHMSVPVLDGETVRLVIGVGNKDSDYDDNDANQLQLIASDVEKLVMRRRAELELKRKTLLLERSNNDLQQFAYIVSHDLREPLRMVSSYLALLERKHESDLSEDAKEFIGFAVDGARRMDTLIQDLIAYSRVQTHGQPLQVVAADQVLSEAIDNLYAALKESGGSVQEEGTLPPVMADPSQLLQLFQNLIGNGLKYHAPGKTPCVTVSAEGPRPIDGLPHQVLFKVRDNGIGIAPAYFDRIFEIFQRLHSRDSYSGTGVGLAVCKRIVERHGGRIWVESIPEQGSTFCFTLTGAA